MGKRGPKPPPLDGPKPCSRCGALKPRTEEFWNRNASKYDGLADQCRDCRKEVRRKEPVLKEPRLTKVCPRCEVEKPLTPEFWWRHRGESCGYQAYCKTCAYTPTGGKGGKKNPHIAEGMKVCPKCGIKKPLTTEYWFHNKHHSSDGFSGWCKPCNTNAANGAKLRDRIMVLSHYSGGGEPRCFCCGDTRVIVLNLDHIEGGGNQHRKEVTGSTMGSLYPWIIKNNFPEGFRVLCRNCDWMYRMIGHCEH